MTSLEIAEASTYVNSFDQITGYFEAPVSGNYQFHMSCDDSCTFSMSLTDPLNPDAMEEIITRPHWTYWRAYNDFDSDVNSEEFQADMFSQWIHLDEGQLHYIETSFYQGGGGLHLTVGFEVEPDTPISNHPMQKR